MNSEDELALWQYGSRLDEIMNNDVLLVQSGIRGK